MGWWFGRKSAPADARPFVPAWLNTDSQEEGFARSAEGMSLFERTSGTWAVFRNGNWETGLVRGASLVIGGQQVVGERQAAIDTPAGGSVVDTEGRLAIAAMPRRIAAARFDRSLKKLSSLKCFGKKRRSGLMLFGNRCRFMTCLHGNRRSHNVFFAVQFQNAVKGDNYAQAGHYGGARVDGHDHNPGRRSGSFAVHRGRRRPDDRRTFQD